MPKQFNIIQILTLQMRRSFICIAILILMLKYSFNKNNTSRLIIHNQTVTLNSSSPLIQGEYELIKISNCIINSSIQKSKLIEATTQRLKLINNTFEKLDYSTIIDVHALYIEINKNDFIECQNLKFLQQSFQSLNFSNNNFLNLTQSSSPLIKIENNEENSANLSFLRLTFQNLSLSSQIFKFQGTNMIISFEDVIFLEIATLEQQSLIHSLCNYCQFSLTNLTLRKVNTSMLSILGFQNRITIKKFSSTQIYSSYLIKSQSEQTYLKLTSSSLFECTFTSKMIEDVEKTEIRNSKFYKIKAHSIVDNAVIVDSNFKQITCESSIIKVNQKSSIKNSIFKDNISYNRGAILNVIGNGSEVIVQNSTFYRNSAIMGSVAFLNNNGSASFFNCSLVENIAQVGGLFYGEHQKSLEIKYFNIFNNSAITSSIMYQLLSFENTTFDTGYIASNNEVNQSLTKQRSRINEPYRLFNDYQIHLENAKLYILKTILENQPDFLAGTSSVLTLENTVLRNTVLTKSPMFLLENGSEMQLTNISITNFTKRESCYQDVSIFSIFSYSLLLASDGFFYQQSSVPLIQQYESSSLMFNPRLQFLVLTSLPFKHQEMIPSLIFVKSGSLSLMNGSFSNISFEWQPHDKNKNYQHKLPSLFHTDEKASIQLIDSTFDNIRNSRLLISFGMSSIVINGITFRNRYFDAFASNISYKYGTSGLYIQDSDYLFIESHYYSIVSPNIGGSVFHLKSQNKGRLKFQHGIQMDKNEFVNNTGAGSVIVVEETNFTLTNSNFTNNTNTQSDGGAITYLCKQGNLKSKLNDHEKFVSKIIFLEY